MVGFRWVGWVVGFGWVVGLGGFGGWWILVFLGCGFWFFWVVGFKHI